MGIRSDYVYSRQYRGKVKAVVLDWSGTTADAYVIAPAVVFVEGFHPLDGTTGHVDGLVRFISATEVVVGRVSDPEGDPVSAVIELWIELAVLVVERELQLLARVPHVQVAVA